MAKHKIKLRVIPKPTGSASVFQVAPPTTVIFQGSGEGKGDYDFICGKCESILAADIRLHTIQNAVLFCNGCQSHNFILPLPLPSQKAN